MDVQPTQVNDAALFDKVSNDRINVSALTKCMINNDLYRARTLFAQFPLMIPEVNLNVAEAMFTPHIYQSSNAYLLDLTGASLLPMYLTRISFHQKISLFKHINSIFPPWGVRRINQPDMENITSQFEYMMGQAQLEEYKEIAAIQIFDSLTNVWSSIMTSVHNTYKYFDRVMKILPALTVSSVEILIRVFEDMNDESFELYHGLDKSKISSKIQEFRKTQQLLIW